MSSNFTDKTLLDIIRGGLYEIGYKDELLLNEYNFVDIRANNNAIRQVNLAAFAQDPPSYRSACFGVVASPYNSSDSIMNYMSLGAPQILALDTENQEILRWKILAKDKPVLVERIEAEDLRTTILSHKDDWNPEKVLRAKSIGFTHEIIQLDFSDISLMPVLEELVFTKLDRVLRDAIVSSELVYKEHNRDEIDYKALFRLIFRFVAAKLLGDRNYPGNWLSSNAQEVIQSVENFYSISTEKVIYDVNVQNIAWKKIREAFSFQNLSVETLAYVYENTLVSEETRKKYGTHATSHMIAEYILQKLPLEDLPFNERYVFEPFSGHAPFLVAALGRLKYMLPSDISIEQRHDYFVKMLAGLELDAFACEVGRYSLILADYPNPNGWQIENSNFFTTPKLDSFLRKSHVVLCNPPYEKFELDSLERESATSPNKAAETLNRILAYKPTMLGFVLPRSFVDGKMYDKARRVIASIYDTVSLTALPDNIFNFSDAETVLLVAYNQFNTNKVWSSALVKKDDYEHFIYTGIPTWQEEASSKFIESQINEGSTVFWYSPLHSIWDFLASLSPLGEYVQIHRGIEYNIPLKENQQELISDIPRSGFERGLYKVTNNYEPYYINSYEYKYLNVRPEKQKGKAYLHNWEQSKVIANAVRTSRGPWSLIATIDYEGLTCYQNFHGIWTNGQLPLEVIVALLNSPIFNAYLTTHNATQHNRKETIEQFPIPKFGLSQIRLIVSLVREYISYRNIWSKESNQFQYFERKCRGILKQLDSEILAAYNLPSNLETKLINYFDGQERPGPVNSVPVKLSYSKRFYESLMRVENIAEENSSAIVEVTVLNWNPHQTVHFSASLIPHKLRGKIERNTWLSAQVNVGARDAGDLLFEDIKLVPEPDVYDRLS